MLMYKTTTKLIDFCVFYRFIFYLGYFYLMPELANIFFVL